MKLEYIPAGLHDFEVLSRTCPTLKRYPQMKRALEPPLPGNLARPVIRSDGDLGKNPLFVDLQASAAAGRWERMVGGTVDLDVALVLLPRMHPAAEYLRWQAGHGLPFEVSSDAFGRKLSQF